MLIRTLKKIVQNGITPKNDINVYVNSPLNNSAKLFEKKKPEIKTGALINKFSDENAKKKLLNNEKLSKELLEKNQKILLMELQKTELLNELKSFYIDIIEMLRLDIVNLIIDYFLNEKKNSNL